MFARFICLLLRCSLKVCSSMCELSIALSTVVSVNVILSLM